MLLLTQFRQNRKEFEKEFIVDYFNFEILPTCEQLSIERQKIDRDVIIIFFNASDDVLIVKFVL